MKFALNKRYQCPFCKKIFVVIEGYSMYSILPVDEISGSEIYDSKFDKDRHVSHLLSCEGMRNIWEAQKEDYRKAVWNRDRKNNESMLR